MILCKDLNNENYLYLKSIMIESVSWPLISKRTLVVNYCWKEAERVFCSYITISLHNIKRKTNVTRLHNSNEVR